MFINDQIQLRNRSFTLLAAGWLYQAIHSIHSFHIYAYKWLTAFGKVGMICARIASAFSINTLKIAWDNNFKFHLNLGYHTFFAQVIFHFRIQIVGREYFQLKGQFSLALCVSCVQIEKKNDHYFKVTTINSYISDNDYINHVMFVHKFHVIIIQYGGWISSVSGMAFDFGISPDSTADIDLWRERDGQMWLNMLSHVYILTFPRFCWLSMDFCGHRTLLLRLLMLFFVWFQFIFDRYKWKHDSPTPIDICDR